MLDKLLERARGDLTDEEIGIVEDIRDGLSDVKIGEKWKFSANTAKRRRDDVTKKLQGYITPEDRNIFDGEIPSD